MKQRYSDAQIVYVLKQVELGEKASEVCRKMGGLERSLAGNWGGCSGMRK